MWLAVLIAAPATLLVAWRFGNRKYYLSSLLLIVYAMLPFSCVLSTKNHRRGSS